MQTNTPERRYDIDWLRVLAVLMLVPFHTARIFDIWEPFYAKNGEVSTALSYVFVGAVNPWHMPLFFLLAGASTWFALGFRSTGQYLKERLKRLLIPLLFGLLVIVPPQSYVALRSHSNYAGTYLRSYARFFEINPAGLEGYTGGFTPAHLWFILFLLVLSLVALPLFSYLRREAGQRLTAGLAAFLSRRRMLVLPAIPLALTLALPSIGGKNPFYYLVLLVYGYVLMSDTRFEKAIDRYKAPALVWGLSTLLIIIVTSASDTYVPQWLDLVVAVYYRSLLTWFLLIAFLGYGRKYLNFTNRALQYASEIAYPFYLLHQTVIVAIGWYVVQWNAGIWAKFLIITVAAALVTGLLVELLARQTRVTRFLFGMKPRSRRVTPRNLSRRAAV